MDGRRNNHKTHEQRIIPDPQVCGDEPVFKGTRVTLRTVLASFADGDSAQQIIVTSRRSTLRMCKPLSPSLQLPPKKICPPVAPCRSNKRHSQNNTD